MKNVTIGGARSLNHTSVILDALRNRFNGYTFTCSDNGVIYVVVDINHTIPRPILENMYVFCDGASDACELLDVKTKDLKRGGL